MNATRRTALGGACLLALAVPLAGCTSQGSTPAPTAGATTSVKVATTPFPTQAPFSAAPVGAVKDLVWDANGCPKDAGHRTVSGKVKNSSKTARDYSIDIIWLGTATKGKPLGAGHVVVKDVKPGQEKDWQVSADVASKADACVPNVVAGTLK